MNGLTLIRNIYRRSVPKSARDQVAHFRGRIGADDYARAYRTAGHGFALRELAAKIFGRPARLPVSVGGVRLEIRPRTSDSYTVEQVFVQRQYGVSLEPAPTTILDAGANIGAAALYFAQRWPHARIAALEPEPSNFALLQDNIRHHPSITAVAGALWPENTTLSLANPGAEKWGFRVTASVASNTGPSIQGFSIPSLLAHLGWETIDLLKMDIEGAEREVFSANPQWLANVRVLMIEIHDELAPGAMDAVQGATLAFGFESSQCGEAWWFTRRDR